MKSMSTMGSLGNDITSFGPSFYDGEGEPRSKKRKSGGQSKSKNSKKSKKFKKRR